MDKKKEKKKDQAGSDIPVMTNMVDQLSSKSEEEIAHLKKKLTKIMSLFDDQNIQQSEAAGNEQQSQALETLKSSLSNMLKEKLTKVEQDLTQSTKNAMTAFQNRIGETMKRIQNQEILEDSFNLESSDQLSFGTKKRLEGSHNYLEKVFEEKDSHISILFKNREEFKTLYNICLAVMMFLLINLMFQEYFETGVFFDFKTLVTCFLGYQAVLETLLVLNIYVLLIVLLVKTIIRFRLSSKIWVFLYIAFQTSIYCLAAWTCERVNLNLASAVVLMCESMRLSMKAHSYLRNKLLYCSGENKYEKYIPKELLAQGITEAQLKRPDLNVEGFESEVKRLIYFIFSPTLIYRDSYPRRKTINLKLTVIHLMNFLLCVYYTFIAYQSFLKDLLLKMAEDKGKNVVVILGIFRTITPATITFFCMFFGVLHSWMNMWAELLRFPDRNFYGKWWSSLEFGSFYRNWFLPGYEFLYHYVYYDIVRFSKGKISRGLAKVLTILISAGMHELTITYATGFFFPILFIIFVGPGILLMKNEKTRRRSHTQHNTTFWILMFFGMGFIMFLYFRENQARTIFSQEEMIKTYGVVGKFLPRSLLYQY